MDNNQTNVPDEHVVIAGKDIKEKLTVDDGKVYGCNIIEGGNVVITSQSSAVQDCKVLKGGKLDVQEGIIIDLIVEDGGKLVIGKNAVFYGVWAKSGSEVWANSGMDGIIADGGSVIHVPDHVDATDQEEAVKNAKKASEAFDKHLKNVFGDDDASCDDLTKEIMDSEHGRDNGEEFDQDADHNPQLNTEDDDLQAKLEEDARNMQFTKGACGKSSDEDEDGIHDKADENNEPLVDSKNRTYLYIEGSCNYEDVLSNILFVVLRYGDHTFTIRTNDADDCIDVDDEDNTVKLYIRRLPRFLDVDDFDLTLTDVVMDDPSTPEDLHLDISLVQYEGAIVDVDLDEGHDCHVFSVDNNGDTPDVKIVLEGEIRGQVIEKWDSGKLFIMHHGKEYRVEEIEGTRSASLDLDDLTFKIEIHPKEVYSITKEYISGDEMLEVLHDCKMIDYIAEDTSPILYFTECRIDGKSTELALPQQDITIKLTGYTQNFKDIIDNLIIFTFYEDYGTVFVIDKKEERQVEYNKKTKMVSIVFHPLAIRLGHIAQKWTLVSGRQMVGALTSSSLSGINITSDEYDESIRIELTGYYVNNTRLDILPHLEPKKYFNEFCYGGTEVQKTIKVEKDLSHEESKKTKEEPVYSDLILEGTYWYFVPTFKLYLEIENETNGTKRYLLWSKGGTSDHGEFGTTVALKFYDATFRSPTETITDPNYLVGKKFKFVVSTSRSNSIGEFNPTKLRWGNFEHTFE